jgi:hypothetical protein
MDTQTSEQALRYEAVLRRALGHRVCDICRDLERSPRWLNKWWREFKAHPETDFAEQARAPHTSPHKTAEEVEQAIIAIRRVLEAGATPETRYGLIGARSIQGKLERLGIKHPPSEATIQRVLAKHHLTHPLGANHESAYYPWPAAWEMNAIFATDIITKHLRGGMAIENFHTLDLYSHAACWTQHLDKTSVTARASAAKLEATGPSLCPSVRQRERLQWRANSSACARSGSALLFVLPGRAILYAGLRSQAQSPSRDVSQSVGSKLLVAPQVRQLRRSVQRVAALLALVPARVSSSGVGGQDGSASAAWIPSTGVDLTVVEADS